MHVQYVHPDEWMEVHSGDLTELINSVCSLSLNQSSVAASYKRELKYENNLFLLYIKGEMHVYYEGSNVI